ncbi:MMPL family transporter [Mycolicibacterium bacteremicum]|uniref:MMPL family transporter n=1 Tax=Mycolicibacterium bacteremicum TaxID=564198 RepID=UPI0026ECCF59|nr:MMPL family transporter [Mycolicibacterium bacteremicum]
MFAWWGRTVYQFRYVVIGVMVALCLGGGLYGASLGQHVTQSGFYDETSESVRASLLGDEVYGRDRTSHVVAILTPPDGEKVDNPEWMEKVTGELNDLVSDNEDRIVSWVGWLRAPDAAAETVQQMKTEDLSKTFVSIPLKGENDDEILKNYQAIEPQLSEVNDGKIQLAGLQPLASELTGTIGEDQKRAEVAAIPLVCVVLFFVFGGVIAAALPGIIGGLTIAGALGIMRVFAEFMPVHFFAQPVVTLMGLGIAIDYGLFMVSRFREELAEGYDTEAAVRRTVMTSGRTVMFSAVILVASSVPLLLFPQGFLKSITYAIIASVMLAAILSVSVLPAALAILGPRVDALGVRWLLKFIQNDVSSDPANTRTNTLAIASIPAGVLLPPAGIALGHLARKRIKQTGEQGLPLTLIGLALGYVGLLGWLAYFTISNKDSLGGGLYWVILGVIIFVAVVAGGLALARWVPLARAPIVWWVEWLAEKTQKTKTRAEVEKGFWGKLVNVVMKRPIAFAAPILIVMILLVLPLGQLALGGISEKYLPPDNGVRQAQEDFDRSFPGFRTEPLTLVIQREDGEPITDQQLAEVRAKAMNVSGFIDADNDPSKMWQERSAQDTGTKDPSVRVLQNGLIDRNDASQKMDELRAIQPPRGLDIAVGGTPALEQDSIHSLFDRLPLMAVVLIVTTTILMFLAFGSVVLPIKAALMSALTLGSTMGILTWMFVDGHGSGLMNYTPQPLMAPMIGLIIAVIWGLSTDYEVFLVSRMVEARERGLSTAEAIRIGTATTGRLITGAALVLAVVAGAFVFSDLVMMKYLAFGLLIALLLDATIIRMFLVPAIMKLLGDDCWWAPRWMRRLQERIGLGETNLPDERKGRPSTHDTDDDEPVDQDALVGAGAPVPLPAQHDPGHPGPPPGPGPRGPVPPPVRPSGPSGSATSRIPAPEPPTTRFAAQPDSAATTAINAVNAPTERRPRAEQNPAREKREIESWLGELRGSASPTTAIPSARPSAQPTRAIPQPEDNEATTAIPAQRGSGDPDSTEKIDTRAAREQADETPTRRGGGVSAADLLRREGRL